MGHLGNLVLSRTSTCPGIIILGKHALHLWKLGCLVKTSYIYIGIKNIIHVCVSIAVHRMELKLSYV